MKRCRLARPERATVIMATLEETHPDWDDPASLSWFRGEATKTPTGYWAAIGWAHRATGDVARAEAGWASIRAAAGSSGRRWPFTPGDAGHLASLGAGALPTLPPGHDAFGRTGLAAP